jgi:hypothetical protein
VLLRDRSCAGSRSRDRKYGARHWIVLEVKSDFDNSQQNNLRFVVRVFRSGFSVLSKALVPQRAILIYIYISGMSRLSARGHAEGAATA